MAELGYLGIHLPNEYGGTAGEFFDLMILMEEMGRKPLPSPFFSTIVLCSLPLLAYGNEEQEKKFLPEIANGNAIWTFALTESSAAFSASGTKLNATLEKKDYHLFGTKRFVPYVHIASYLLVVGRTGEKDEERITVFILDGKSPGISVEVIPTTAHDKQCEVNFDNVRVPKSSVLCEVGKGCEIIHFILQRGAILKCAEMLGGAQAALEITTDYAKKKSPI